MWTATASTLSHVPLSVKQPHRHATRIFAQGVAYTSQLQAKVPGTDKVKPVFACMGREGEGPTEHARTYASLSIIDFPIIHLCNFTQLYARTSGNSIQPQDCYLHVHLFMIAACKLSPMQLCQLTLISSSTNTPNKQASYM